MLRGLVVRQGFMIAEGIVGLVIILIAVSAIRDLYSSPVASGNGTQTGFGSGRQVMLKKAVDARADYESIISSKIFGSAASYIHNAPPAKTTKPAQPVKPAVVDSKLPLILKGTLHAGLESPFSSANIQVNEKGMGLKTFFIGAEVIDRVFLIKVLKNEVWLNNTRTTPNQEEILKHELDVKIAKGPSGSNRAANLAKQASARPTTSGRPTQQKLITLNRKSTVAKLEKEYKRLASTIDIVVEKDDKGNILGVSTSNVESITVLSELGFKNGDILVSVNNEKVTSQDQISSLANKYRNSNVVRVGVLRAGKPMNFTYRLR